MRLKSNYILPPSKCTIINEFLGNSRISKYVIFLANRMFGTHPLSFFTEKKFKRSSFIKMHGIQGVLQESEWSKGVVLSRKIEHQEKQQWFPS